jgi:hypothetical protein
MDTSWKRKPDQERGVICGCDYNQEWLLPWWWERYRFNNDYPVLFCDYGMSKKAKAWCQERGKVVTVSFDETQIRSRKDVPPVLQKKWEKHNNFCWSSRSSWFKKPFAMLESPFKVSVWLDLDCEVLSHLGDLFEYCSFDVRLAIASCNGKIISQKFPCRTHNGGVIVYYHGIDIIEEQAEWILEWNHQFMAEDNVLSYLIFKNNFRICDLPLEWNWLSAYGMNLYARIFHWNYSSKNYLKTHDGIKPFRDSLEQKSHCKTTMSAQIRADVLGFGSFAN